MASYLDSAGLGAETAAASAGGVGVEGGGIGWQEKLADSSSLALNLFGDDSIRLLELQLELLMPQSDNESGEDELASPFALSPVVVDVACVGVLDDVMGVVFGLGDERALGEGERDTEGDFSF